MRKTRKGYGQHAQLMDWALRRTGGGLACNPKFLEIRQIPARDACNRDIPNFTRRLLISVQRFPVNYCITLLPSWNMGCVMSSAVVRHEEGRLRTGLGWYVQTVPGPSPCLFSVSLTNLVEHPWRLHCVPGVTATARSSSSTTAGSGFGVVVPLTTFEDGLKDLVV